MSVIALALNLMLAEGIPLEKVLATVAEMEAEIIRVAQQSAFSAAEQADRRSPGAKRTAKWRASQNVTERHEDADSDAPSLDNKGLPHTPSKQLNPPKENPPKGGQKKGNALPADWQPTPADLEYGRNLGLADRAVTEAAEDMRQWADANSSRDVARKSNWSAAFKGWLRREAEKKGQHGSKAEENKRRELLRSQFY
jgi:hypothetical protein